MASIKTTKRSIINKARALGASLVNFAPASRWDELGEVHPDYRPKALWDKAETVIVIAVPMLLPVLESTPSINYQEMYNATNAMLDQIGFRLSVWLNDRGHASIFMPRDGYGNLEILLNKYQGCFSHVFASKYAGQGTIAYSHNLITPEYGPRVRLVSVFTSLKVPADPMLTSEVCLKCDICRKLCPSQAFTTRPDSIIAEMDVDACTRYHQVLRGENRWPCGICCKVCPVGEDRKLYESVNSARYLKEREVLEQNPDDPEYRSWVHQRRHGSSGDRIY
ncbi:epoxyqueuosine reductase [Geomesophilobacter sediminis]|uniref:Epoxyqueuosine reductase n=1 Tax=Geomesophilobacter sediminis TaxID=2798584 RepID=A0A8J7LU74_9BACT|nr:epoxyqueuosine reductase [Geomesophilobacter sediminis]MBJ6724334.1 epoxyqueuosine reductase [Geomesophilobacter sediminis]